MNKQFVLGLVMGMIFAAPSAYAIGVNFEDMTMRDLFAAAALSGLASSYFDGDKARAAFRYSDLMMQFRKK